MRFGDLEVTPSEGVVTKAGQAVHLTKTEFLLLCDLAQHPSQVMSRDLLLQRVWGYEYTATAGWSTPTSDGCA